jgi:hypothetical protein
VHYVFLGNDLHEIGRPSLCCDQKGLVVYGDHLRARCESPEYRIPLRERLESSPAPYPVRALAHRSALAAQLVAGFARLGALIARSGAAGEQFVAIDRFDERQFDRFARLEDRLRASAESVGARFTVVVLPSRQMVTAALGRDPEALDLWQGAGMAARSRVVEILKKGDFDFIDAFELLRSLVQSADEPRWFARDFPGDFHFSIEGHERMARWLWPRLERRFRGAEDHVDSRASRRGES